MWKLLALLPCLLLVAQVSGECAKLLACENEISDGDFFEESGLVSYADEAAVLDAVCSELSNLTTCIATNLDSCTETSIKNEIRAVKDIIVYMCSEEGRQVVLDLADSSCANDPLIETRMEIMMMGCLEDFQFGIQMAQLEAHFEGREFNISEVCPFIDELHVCIVNNGAEMCGPAMGSFLSSIWGIASRDQFTQFGCHQEAAVTRRALKRAVPMLLKRAALIRKYRK